MRRCGAPRRRRARAAEAMTAPTTAAPESGWGPAPAGPPGRSMSLATPAVRRRRPRRRSAGVGPHDIHRLVAAERTEGVAKRLVGARPDFAIALERGRLIDARPRRRRAGDLVETGARIAEQFLFRHRGIRARRIGRRLRRQRPPLVGLARRTRRGALAGRSSRDSPRSEAAFPAAGAAEPAPGW